jgi:hypothetical protein
VIIGSKVALLLIPFGGTYFLVHEIHVFTVHVTILIIVNFFIFYHNSHLILNSANLCFFFSDDGL